MSFSLRLQFSIQLYSLRLPLGTTGSEGRDSRREKTPGRRGQKLKVLLEDMGILFKETTELGLQKSKSTRSRGK